MQAGDLPAAPGWRSDSAARLADPSHCRPLSTATSVREPWRQPQDRTLSPLASLYAVLRVAQLHVCALDKVRAHVSRRAHEGWRQVWLPLVPEGCFQPCIFQIAILLRLLNLVRDSQPLEVSTDFEPFLNFGYLACHKRQGLGVLLTPFVAFLWHGRFM